MSTPANRAKGLQPRLRFPEFRDKGAWEIKRIDAVSDKIFSGGTPVTTEQGCYGGKIPFIRSAEIGEDKTELFLTQKGLESSAAKIVKKGDVLFALYGANSENVAISKIDGAINQAVLCIKSKNKNIYIFQYLNHKKEFIISKYIQGGQGNLSGEIVKSIKIEIPLQTEEQQKIADCLSSIDDVITAQAQKLEALKAHKKGLMQQLFPCVEGDV